MLKYWLWLATRNLTPRQRCSVARHFGSAKDAYFAKEDAYAAVSGIRSPRDLLDKDLNEALEILADCKAKKIRIITMQDAAYPTRLAQLKDAPVVLYCKGAEVDLNDPMIAIVGTRKSSAYGMAQAKQFGFGLARCGFTVISGGAAGVDTKALRGALLGDGTAIAVLGGGVDVIYPKSNADLFWQIEKNGCLISEYPPGTTTYPSHFPERNRIISGLSLGVLVTEAPEKSGSLITARDALEQDRDVYVLPANLGAANCAGNVQLMREGAVAVTQVWDILQEYQSRYPDILKENEDEMPEEPPMEELRQEPESRPKEKKVIDKPEPKAYIDLKETKTALTEKERMLAELLRDGPMHLDILSQKASMTAGEILANMTMLQVKGIVCRPSGGLYELTEK